MKFKSFVTTVMAILGITAWAKEDEKNVLTSEQKEKLKTMGFNDVFLQGFEKALADDFKDEEGAAAIAGAQDTDARVAVLNGLLAQTSQALATAQADLEAMKAEKKGSEAILATKLQEIQTLQGKVNTLSALAEQDPGKGAQRPAEGAQALNLDDDKQLGGMQGIMFALDRPYNLRAKAALLAAQGIQMNTPVASSLDYETLKADLGAFYRVPWQQRLQSFLMELPSLEKIFPLQSGYQDLATLVNIWLGEFSQADNTVSSFDNVTKGNYDFGTETLRMFDVMFAHKFTNLKALEKNWLGSLNREGSQVIKWSFIEFILAETAKKLHNEREQRRINGIRKDPDLNKPGRAMEAADGVYEFIRKKVDGHLDGNGKTVYQIKPFALGKITPENIGDLLYKGTSMIPAVLRDSGSICCYLPSYMVVWYDKYNELHYGRNTDYQGAIRTVKEYPSVKIVSVPNADGHERIIWTMDGNIQLFEDRPGEMLNFNLEQQDWTLKVWSNWKESVWAVAVGFKYNDKSKMGYDRQMIFCTDYDLSASTFIEAAPDKNPDVKLHTSVVTVANSTQFAITDIDNAEVGVPVVIKCGSKEKGVTIAKSGKFSLLTSAWTPEVGETITLMKRADGKFIELGRGADLTGVMAFAADATAPSVEGGTEFVTDANTKATALTDLAGASKGVTYTIYGAGSTNATTIANEGNFSLTAAMTLSAGKWIQLVKAADGKFYEVARG